MKHYVEQQLFSLKDRFYIQDEFGHEEYYVESDFFSFGKKFHIYDQYQQQVAYISQKVWSFLPKFEIYVENNYIGQIVKELTLFNPRYYLENSDLQVEGNFLAHDYSIYNSQGTIATISKEWWTFGDKYCIDVKEGIQPIIAIAIMLSIDAVLASQNNAASSAAIQ